MNKEKFQQSINKVFTVGDSNGFGTIKEKNIHAVLKEYFADYSSNTEVNIGKYIADIVNPNEIIEIQTQSFYRLKNKLSLFLKVNNVCVVYPLIVKKRINWIDEESGVIKEKRQTKKGNTIYHLFAELYQIKEYLNNPKLSFDICMLEVSENRLLDGDKRKKRWNSTSLSLFPTAIIDEFKLESLCDYIKFIPDSVPKRFTSMDLKFRLKIPFELASKMANVLCYLQVIKHVDNRKNYYIYERNYNI